MRELRDSTRRDRDSVLNCLEPLQQSQDRRNAQQSQQHSGLMQLLQGYSNSITKVPVPNSQKPGVRSRRQYSRLRNLRKPEFFAN
jgi:hypothetical protein